MDAVDQVGIIGKPKGPVLPSHNPPSYLQRLVKPVFISIKVPTACLLSLFSSRGIR